MRLWSDERHLIGWEELHTAFSFLIILSLFVLLLFNFRPFCVLAGSIERLPPVLGVCSCGKRFQDVIGWFDELRVLVHETVEVSEQRVVRSKEVELIIPPFLRGQRGEERMPTTCGKQGSKFHN